MDGSGQMNLVLDDGGQANLKFDSPVIRSVKNYEELENLPLINGHQLIGDQRGYELGLQDVCFGTTDHWNGQRDFIPDRGQIVIYMDHGTVDDGNGGKKNVPGIKIGDGNAYLIDMPFLGDDVANSILYRLNAHLQNQDIHVSAADRLRWDKKVDVRLIDNLQGEQEVIEFFRE